MDLCGTQVIGQLSCPQQDNNNERIQIGVLRIGQEEHKVLKGVNRIGRSPLCAIILNDTTVSKVHAEIQADVGVTFLGDLRSSNGTKIKNTSLKPFFYYQVADGDLIHFGTVEALYSNIERSERRATVPASTSTSKADDSQKCSTTLENLPGDSFNESSTCEIDHSVLLGARKKHRTVKRAANVQKVSETRPLVPLIELKRLNTANLVDIQDMETQPIADVFLRDIPAPKRPRLEEQAAETNLYEAETQIIPVTEAVLPPVPDPSNDSDSHPVNSPTPSEESLNLLNASNYREIYEKDTKPNVTETRAGSRPDMLQGNKNHGDEKSRVDLRQSRECNMVAETDDSLTDEDIDLEIRAKKSREDNVIVNKPSDNSIKIQNDSNEVRNPVDDLSNTEDDIFNAATQLIIVNSEDQTVPAEVANISVNSRNSRVSDDSELPPTQIIEAPPTSTPLNCYKKAPQVWPFFGKSIQKNVRNERDAIMVADSDDFQYAPTQIIRDTDVCPRSGKTTEHDEIRNKSHTAKSPKDLNKSDDNISKELQELVGRETGVAESIDESTQLMTQNLIDILKPSQHCNESSISVAVQNSPQRRQEHRGPGTLGFVEGRAVDSRTEFVTTPSIPKKSSSHDKVTQFVSTASTPKKNSFHGGKTKRVSTPSTPKKSGSEDRETQLTTTAPAPQKTGSCDKETKTRDVTSKTDQVSTSSTTRVATTPTDNVAGDDILFGLPKVSICGTFSNPGSPAVSSTSSRNDQRSSRSREVSTDRESLKGTSRNCVVGLSRIDQFRKPSESLERDSPIQFKTGGKTATRRFAVNRIVDEDDDENKGVTMEIDDSDDELDYHHLRKIADKLLESPSNASNTATPKRKTRSRGRTTGATDHSESSLYNVRKTLNSKRVALSKRRDDELSRAPLSLAVTDESAATTTNRSEIPAAKTQQSKGGIESQEVEGILAGSHKQEEDLVLNSPVLPVRPRRTLSKKTLSTSISSARSSPSTEQNNSRISHTARHHAILFTGINEEGYIKIITKLGGSVVSEPYKATVLVTDKIRRTFKFLCAVARGIPVVSDTWLKESEKVSRFLDCADFILKDPAAEAMYKFSLGKSLQRARERKIFDGFTLIVTPKVNQPDINQLRGMVEASGGRVLVRAPRSWDSKMIIISREEDITAARALLAKSPKFLKITVHSIEFVLSGILQQEVRLNDFKLDLS